MKSIVCISPTRLGDTLFCTPAYRYIKLANPEARLEVIALTEVAFQVLQDNIYIDHLHQLYDLKLTELIERSCEVIHLHRHKDAEKLLEQFQASGIVIHRIEPQDDSQHCAEQTRNFVEKRYGVAVDDHPGYEVVASVGSSTNALSESGCYIGLHLGCHGLKKHSLRFWKPRTHQKVWPLEKFIELASRLKNKIPNVRFVLTGSGEESRLAKQFEQHVAGCINLVGDTSVGELASVFQKLDLFVCCDTGPLHIACATDTPLIALYGPTEYHRTYPYPHSERRVSISSRDLKNLKVDQVFEQVVQLLDSTVRFN